MAGFRQQPNYDFLNGLELSCIQVSPYTIAFVFVENPEINIGSEFDHFEAATGVTSKYQASGQTKDFTVQRLPGRRVVGTEILSDDALKLAFDNGDTLTLLRTNPRYESMTINKPNGGVIVIM
jgi:hypothetical protein